MTTARAPEFEDFKGYPVIKIFTGKEYKGEPEYISLGVRKAQAILDNVDYIRKFVAAYENGGLRP